MRPQPETFHMAKISGRTEIDIAVDREALNRGLCQWASATLRDLPWRSTRDPWLVLVSEVMLQQTQVNRVTPKYNEFLRRWPSPEALTESTLSDLLKLWQGLGYPRRARNLFDSAHRIVQLHDGEVPNALEDLLALPGVGPYTARAVLVFAFELPFGVLDTNVGRLLARWTGRSLGPKEGQDIADELVDPDRPWLWNQGLFDLAALQCVKRNPQCGECPVNEWCSWRGVGDDPASGSAGVSTGQTPFQGSDRQARGRMLKALTKGPVPAAQAAEIMELEGDIVRATRLINDLRKESLITVQDEALLLGDLLQ